MPKGTLRGGRQSARQSARQVIRRGAVLILVLLLLVILFAGAAFSIDVGYMQLARTQLRNASDAAAIAAAEALKRTNDASEARKAAQEFAQYNLVAGKPLLLGDSDIVVGRMVKTGGVSQFMPGQTPYDAVRINGEFSDSSLSGPIDLFFGRVLNRATFSPQMFAVGAIAKTKRDLAIVVDRSGSMNDYSKWDGLLEAYDYLIEGLDSTDDVEQLGLASYSTLSTLDARLSTNYAISRDLLRDWSPSGWTNIHDGIMNGITILTDGTRRSDAEPLLVVLTDGIWNRGGDPANAANVAAANNIPCLAITFGADADQTKMKEIADITKGQFFHAPTSASLRAIFSDIGSDRLGVSFEE